MKPLLLLALTTPFALAQGPLIPPAAPAPSMKALAQIEARTPIPASPAVPIAGQHFTITAPGSYYLTGNIQVTSGDGILIDSSNVTLDFNGFALISTTVAGPTTGNAINLGSGVSNIHLRNGNILGGTTRTAGPPVTYTSLGWYAGISDKLASPSENVQISQINVKGCGYGIFLNGKGSILSHINASGNEYNGIATRQGSITSSIANNNGQSGIVTLPGSVITSHATGNGDSGIYVSNGSITNCTATKNARNGISAYRGVITSSVASDNGGDGIFAQQGVVSDCRAFDNDTNPDLFIGVGIRWPLGKLHNSLADTALPAIP